MQSTVVHHANKTTMDKLEQHYGELPGRPGRVGALRGVAAHCAKLGMGPRGSCDNLFVTMSPDTKAMQAIRKSLAQQKKAAAVASACKANPKGKGQGKGQCCTRFFGRALSPPVAAASLVEDMVGTIKHYTECLAAHDLDVGGAREQAHVIVCGVRFGRQSVLPREASLPSHSGNQ